MIKFDKLWNTMQTKGVTTYQLREKCGIDSKTIRRLHANDNIEKFSFSVIDNGYQIEIYFNGKGMDDVKIYRVQ